MPQKLTCIIDADSCINLLNCEITDNNGRTIGTAFHSLKEITELRFSETVRADVERNLKKIKIDKWRIPLPVQRSKMILPCSRRTVQDYERILFTTTSPSNPQESQGEKHNFALTLDLFLSRKRPLLVFLSDDKRAYNGFLKHSIENFPICLYWSSFDAVLFLALAKNDFYENAEQILRTLNNEIPERNLANQLELMRGIFPQTTPQEELKLKETRLAKYLRYLEKIKTVQ